MTSLATTVQTSAPGEYVELFRLDTSSIGGQVLYFCQSAFETKGPTFGGVYYTPVDVEFEGMETNVGGSLPRPKVRVANMNGVFQSIINQYGDLLGCQIQRVRTFAQYLDDGAEADPTQYRGPDTFKIERKLSENPVYVEWELSANIDQEGKQLPGRQCIRDTCLWRYRQFNPATGNFDYSKAQCLYTGSNYFDRNGNPVATRDKDQCGRKLSDCELRFGKGNPLYTSAFPGVGRVRA
ncbi:phage minor tail protein L [Phyllobacterium myrsinacearum]|uniref:Lambda family phage minor tail protein L n=1 Tax=Phyllobacterium myrsinacearum TaxID=28101 RepID=A0A839EMD9_9HYPH|nr:phage minor tail protein L [Phyllobacterium myrsinacearum]MBA8881733.1 lambda family phage minor tail protein L [Phyllobacterium myrsinacearum]